MLGLEGLTSFTDKPLLVVHLPGFNRDSITKTPWLQRCESGKEYRKALDTAVSEAGAGRVRPEQIAAFLARADRSLERADEWLRGMLDDPADGFGAQLRAMRATLVLDDLLSGGPIADRARKEGADALWNQLGVWTGLDFGWRDVALPPEQRHPTTLRSRLRAGRRASSTWTICAVHR